MPFGRPTENDRRREELARLWLQRQEPLAVVSLVLGVISLIECGVLLVFGMASIICGIVALRRLRDGSRDGRKLAWSGIVLSLVSLAIAIWLYTDRAPFEF